jgi:hypothetical protein
MELLALAILLGVIVWKIPGVRWLVLFCYYYLTDPGTPEPAPASVLAYSGGAGTLDAPAAPAASPGRIVLSPVQWLALCNERPDDVPHLLIRGGSGAGKTELTRAILSGRTGTAVVLSPKPEDAPRWAPLSFVTVDDDATYSSIARALEGAVKEMLARNILSKRDAGVQHTPITIVVDDAGVIGLDREAAAPLRDAILRIGRLGRSTRVRLIVIADTSNARTLGIDGEAASLVSFAKIDVARDRSATITLAGETAVLDTRMVQALARRALHLDAANLLGEPTNDPANERSIDRSDEPNGPESPDPGPFVRPFALPRGDKQALIDFLVAQGWNVSDVRSTIKGEAAVLSEMVRRAQGEIE